MARCPRCETLPGAIEAPRQVFLWPPLGHTLGKIKAAAKVAEGFEPVSGGLRVIVNDETFAALIGALRRDLTDGEMSDTACLVYGGEDEPTIDDFGAISTLRKVAAFYASDWLLSVLREDRLVSNFHPIVFGDDPDKVAAHECLLRWVDDNDAVQSPVPLFSVARDADLLFQLDRAAREAHIRNAAANRIPPGTRIFVNFTPTAIYDPKNCLQSTFKVIEEVGLSPEQIVFEVIETERIEDSAHLKSILNQYQANGFKVALDDLGAGHSTLNMLGALRPDVVKLDIELVRNVHEDRFRAEIVRRIIELAHKFDIEVVAEGVEIEEEAQWLQSQNVDYLQGFLYAKPSPTFSAMLG